MKLNIVFLATAVIAVGLVGAAVLTYEGIGLIVAPQGINSVTGPDFLLMAEAWNTIEHYYVDRPSVRPRAMAYMAIAGMVDTLGDTGHSTFMTPEMVRQEKELARGQYKGIGVEIRIKDKRVVVVAPIDGSPAEKAGLRAGTVILRIDGHEISGLSLPEVSRQILGPEGTPVTLTTQDPTTGLQRDVTLIRRNIIVQNARWGRLPGSQVAHLRIAAFSDGVTGDVRKALTVIQKQGLKGIILDLRNDPGGLLDEAVQTASLFLRGGNVLLEKNAAGDVTPVPVRPGGVAAEIPLVVLINGGTASAAEIVAGALKDAHRATLVGEKTFGTGTVLREFPLSDGSALLLAVREWLTPDGTTIWHKGISPNVTVALPEGVAPSIPETEQGMTAAGLESTNDTQLLQALALLSGREVKPKEGA
jgi:carboxyl-terminal processing protease